MFRRSYQPIDAINDYGKGPLKDAIEAATYTVENHVVSMLLKKVYTLLPLHERRLLNPLFKAVTVTFAPNSPLPIGDFLSSQIVRLDAEFAMQVLEAYLSEKMVELSTLREDPSRANQDSAPQHLPTLAETRMDHPKDAIPWAEVRSSSHIESPYHSILALRDRLISWGYCGLWSNAQGQRWVSDSRRCLQKDIEITAICRLISSTNSDKLKTVLRSAAKRMANEVLQYTAFTNSLATDDLIENLKGETISLLRLRGYLVGREDIESLEQAVATDQVRVQDFLTQFVDRKLSDIVDLVQNVLTSHDEWSGLQPDHDHPVAFREKYEPQLLADLCTALTPSADVFPNLIYEWLPQIIDCADGNFHLQWEMIDRMDQWIAVVGIDGLQVENSVELGPVKLMSAQDCKLWLDNTYPDNRIPKTYLPDAQQHATWAVASHILAGANDSDKVVLRGREMIREMLSVMYNIIEGRTQIGFVLGDSTFVLKPSDNSPVVLVTTKVNAEFSKPSPLDLRGDLFPNAQPWAIHLKMVAGKDMDVAKNVRLAMRSLFMARRQSEASRMLTQLLDSAEMLLSLESDGRTDFWMDRLAIMLGGPNMPLDTTITFAQARQWLRDDLRVYATVRDKLTHGRYIPAVDRMIPRVETIVVNCFLIVYSALNLPELQTIDDLTWWYLKVRPQESKVWGSVNNDPQ